MTDHLLTIEIFIGDVEHFELADDSTPYIEDAANSLDAVRKEICQMEREERRLMQALTDIAQGNVPPGFLEPVFQQTETPAQFKERFCTWMQATAKAAIDASSSNHTE